jgi:hypothetical protein
LSYRIALWAGAGLVVVGCWQLYFLATFPLPMTAATPILWTLARLTCPIAALGAYFHFGVGLDWVLAANAATYALVGLIVETLRGTLRRPLHPAR